jgi:predicted N-acetyltransferase YhbS
MGWVSDQQILIRPAGPADRDQVWHLARDLATSYTAGRPAFERSYASLLAHPDALVLVAETAGAIVGYLLATTRRAAPFYQALGYEESAVHFRKLLD